MVSRLLKNKDFWAGMMLIGIGAAAMFIARDYRFGSAMRMGPGFFPTILGGILIAFGVCIMAVGCAAVRGSRSTCRSGPWSCCPFPSSCSVC